MQGTGICVRVKNEEEIQKEIKRIEKAVK